MKRLAMCLFCFLFTVFFTGDLNADPATATPAVYKLTVNKVEFYNSDTATWVTVGEGDMTFDIASVSAGAVVGGYISGSAIPEGTYTQIRTTVSRTMTIKATDGTQYTTATAYITPKGYTFILQSPNIADYAEGTYIIPGDALGGTISGGYFTLDAQNFEPSFLVKKGITRKVRIKFDVSNTAIFAGTYVYSSAPSVAIDPVE